MNRTRSNESRSGSSGLTPAALLVMMLLVGVLQGCGAMFGPVRATPFPPDLTYIPKHRIQTAMWVLAAEIQELERVLMLRLEGERDSHREAAISAIQRMKVAARTLDEPGRSSQHPALNRNLNAFIGRLDRAKRALDRDPPDFFPASTIVGSCYLCHGQVQTAASDVGSR